MTAAQTFQTPGIRWEKWTDREQRITLSRTNEIFNVMAKWPKRKKSSQPNAKPASGASRTSRRAAGILT